MSTKDDRIKVFFHEKMLERLKLFRDMIKSSFGEDFIPKSLSAANLHNYRVRKNIPNSDALESLGTNFGLNLHWLFWGEGEMLRKSQAEPASDMQAENSRLKDKVISLYDELNETRKELETLRRTTAEGNLEDVSALGKSSVVPLWQQKIERETD